MVSTHDFAHPQGKKSFYLSVPQGHNQINTNIIITKQQQHNSYVLRPFLMDQALF